MAEYDILAKLLLIGPSSAGKSNLLLRFADNAYTDSFIATIGVDFKIRNMSVDDCVVKLQIWDTAGQERFRTITSSYYRGADAILVVFDLTDGNGLQDAKTFLQEARRYNSECLLFLVGTKSDLREKRAISEDTARRFVAADEGIVDYFEASAKSGENVEDLFSSVTKATVQHKKGTNAADANKKKPTLVDSELAELMNASQDILRAEGGKPFLFSMLCLVGEGRAGKSGLKNALLGKSFETTDSTIGMSQEILQVVKEHIEANQSSWMQYNRSDHNQMDEACARIVAEKIKRAKQSSVDKPNSNDVVEKNEGHNKKNDDFIGAALLSGGHTNSNNNNNIINTTNNQKDQTNEDKDILGAFKLDQSLVLRFSKENVEKEPLKFTMWDFGGQEIFYTLHHLFLNRFGVYLVTFNMEWLVPRYAGGFVEHGLVLTAEERMQRCLDMLQFWLKSILLHTQDKKDGTSAPVFLVGTHKDKVGDVADHAQISKLLHTHFASDFPNLHAFKEGEVPTGRGVLWFFPVNNVLGLGDPVLRSMMESIEAVVREEEYTKKKVPFSWLAVCDRLQSESRKSMRLKDFEEVCSECGVPSSNMFTLEEEVQMVLQFYSNLGMIMYHAEPCLRDLVVVNPAEYLIGAITKFMCNEDIHPVPEHREARKLTLEWKMLTRYGILDHSILKVLWSSYNEEATELEHLMCKFGLVIPLVEDNADDDGKIDMSRRKYLVPALLPNTSTDGSYISVVKTTAAWGNNPDSLTCCILFAMDKTAKLWQETGAVSYKRVTEEGFLPHGIFTRLIGKAVACCQMCSSEAIDLTEVPMSAQSARLAFGDHSFTLKEISRDNMIMIEIHVDNTIVVVESLNVQIQQVLRECVPHLEALFAVPVDHIDGLQPSHFILLHGDHGLHSRVAQGRGPPTSVAALMENHDTLDKKFAKWLPPSGLLDQYDVFVSYRWNAFDSAFAEGLFYTMSRENVHKRQTRVFLDKQRLQGGKNFVSDFMKAMKSSTVVVPLVSVQAMERMLRPKEEDRDNVLVEWMLALELHQLGILKCLHPIMIGHMKDATNPMEMSSFFTHTVGGIPLIEALPNVTAPVVISEVERFLKSLGLEPTAELSSRTIRQTVKQMTDFLGTPCWQVGSTHGQSVSISKGPHLAAGYTKKLYKICSTEVMKIIRSNAKETVEIIRPKTPPKTQIPPKSSSLESPTSMTSDYNLHVERAILEAEKIKLEAERERIEAKRAAEAMKLEAERERFEVEKLKEMAKIDAERAKFALEKATFEANKTKQTSASCDIL